MRVVFYEKQQQSYFWKVLGSQDDKVTKRRHDLSPYTLTPQCIQVCWEEWIVPIRLVGPANSGEAAARRRLCAEQIQERMQFVLKTVTEKKEHIPPVPKELTGTTTFYHEIKIPNPNWMTGTTTFYHEIKIVSEKTTSSSMHQAVKGMSSAKLI